MTLATRTLRLHLLSTLGAPFAGAKVTLQLSAYQADESDIVPLNWELTEDPLVPGDYVGPIWPNTRNDSGTHYDMLVQASGQQLLTELVTVTVAAGEAVLKSKINPPPYPPVYGAAKAVGDANVFADAAGESASRAIAAVATIDEIAEDYGTVAAAAASASESAVIAGSAKVGAVSAEEGAESAKSAAQAFAEAAQSAASIQKSVKTWPELSPIVGAAGQAAQVIADAGTHVDPVSGATVPNTGQYLWDVPASAWTWVRPDLVSTKADKVELAETSSDLAWAKNSLPLSRVAPGGLLPLVGVTNAALQVQAPAAYNILRRRLEVNGVPVLDAVGLTAEMANSLPTLYSTPLPATKIPLIGITDPAGNMQTPVTFDVVTGVVEVIGVPISGGEGTQDALPAAVASASASGLNVTVDCRITRLSGVSSTQATLALGSAGTPAVVDEAYTLKYSTALAWWQNPNAKLQYRFVRGVTVAEGGVPLVEGVAYAVMLEGGKLRGLVNTADRAVQVSYTGLQQRYDLICADGMTGALSVVQGVNRIYDAEEFMPQEPAGKIALFSVFVVGDQVLDILPVYAWQGTDFRGRSMARLQRHNRSVLAPAIAAAMRADDLTLVGYGDSITALGGAASHTAPNGPVRDNISFFTNYPADVILSIPTFDFGDGAGAVHVKLGWNWQLKSWLESACGSAVDYQNFGIGGSSSGTGQNGDRLNGLNPTRLGYALDAVEAAAATRRVVVVLAFGMNELGSTDTVANVVALVQAFKAVGAIPVVMGVPRPCSYGGFGDVPRWKFTNDSLYVAAISSGAAFVPFASYLDDAFLGYARMSPRSLCGAANINHPGPSEFGRLSQLLIDLFRN
ncbi:SGNH/GDSL hydrolase family protein [Variovorax paradoxus]|uniref:SGNH hydrolase-type esterase domain-containing protein n=1 Tax=Variovorax paradoxus TaxID=34073 RepID=A0A0H2M1W2_VARPD|nr:SGNH/GDSL hydrolase family protein [Variovorax paradoxus]KLN54742.1 hypothetical protein VPARA_40460 [Variovorax paradoxus]